MATKKGATIDPIRTVAFGSIGASYTKVGDIVDDPTRMVYIYNSTDKSLYLSDDGINDKFLVPTGAFILLDVATNTVGSASSPGFFLPEQEYWWVKHAGVAPTSGAIHITLIHGGF